LAVIVFLLQKMGEIMLNETNFWLSTTSRPNFPATGLPTRVDLAVIGGGFSGLSAARILARAGAKVAVLEAQTMGWGASSRNGGMVLTGMKLGVETLIKKYGRERAKRLFALSLAAIDCVEEIVQAESIDCNFGRCGHLETAWKPAHFDGYARAAEMLEKEVGHTVRIVPKADIHSEIGSDLYHGGMVDETSAGINPARFVFGLANAAAQAGALILENTEVYDITKNHSDYTMKTSRGTLRAGQVFVGTSGYTSRTTPAIQKRIIPIGSYIIATAPLPDALAAEVSPRNRMIFDSKHFLYYFRLTPDNRMLFGGRAAFMPETAAATRNSAEILQRGMIEVFPQLRDIPVEYVWGGNLDFSFDIMPHAGNLDGLWHAIGYAGHGVAFATHLGKTIAQQMLGEKVENPLADLPFPRIPFYNGNPLIHLPAAWLYYSLLDMIE
jgi:glycine/D-amino acid oxidase-like deaminating enzyme